MQAADSQCLLYCVGAAAVTTVTTLVHGFGARTRGSNIHGCLLTLFSAQLKSAHRLLPSPFRTPSFHIKMMFAIATLLPFLRRSIDSAAHVELMDGATSD
jgi:hypothetical protein